jgi:ubiquitin C-terminal hydrolase
MDSASDASAAAATAPAPAPAPAPPPKDPRLKGVVGLQNMGNTCYANSTLQLLRAVPELNTFCLQPDLEARCVDKDSVPSRILLAYQDLLRSLWSAHRPCYVRPLGFLSIIRDNVKGTLYENFARPMQNDSHEYMVYLLDNFHEALNTRAKEAPLPSPTGTPSTPEEMRDLAARGWTAFTHRNQSPIVDQFFGMTRKTLECQGCKHKSYQWETFNVFKISSSGSTFDEWIRNEYTPETIDGFECTPCKTAEKGRQTLKIQTHLWQLPSTLFVGIKRFTPDGRKVMTPCPYNGKGVSFGAYFAEESDHPSKAWAYECRAVADHHGGHLGGHYSAQFCHPITNDWWWMDDEMSQLMQNGPLFGPSTYVLFFRRIYTAATAAPEA